GAQPWSTLLIDESSPGVTSMQGGVHQHSFGEEFVGARDWNGDAKLDVFVGDLAADISPTGDRSLSGAGYVFYDAASLKGRVLNRDSLPQGLHFTEFIGAAAGDISSDTAIGGDFDGDGHDDLALCSPHADIGDRHSAGTIHIFFGSDEQWPAAFDLASTN